MFLQLRYRLDDYIMLFEKPTITPLGRWKLKDDSLYNHFGDIDNDIGIKYHPMKQK